MGLLALGHRGLEAWRKVRNECMEKMKKEMEAKNKTGETDNEKDNTNDDKGEKHDE